MSPSAADEYTEGEVHGAQLLVALCEAFPNGVAPAVFGQAMWPHSPANGHGGGALSRAAGAVLVRLQKAGLAVAAVKPGGREWTPTREALRLAGKTKNAPRARGA